MKILFLGYQECELREFLCTHYQTTQTHRKINKDFAKKFDFIISFGYKHIISEDIISSFPAKIVNLHISYLPYNRGYHPNFWALVENSPKGVTIHQIDKGIDTGNILLQKKVAFSPLENTFKKTYNKLINEIQALFIDNCSKILHNHISPRPQCGAGSFHYKKDIKQYEDLLTLGWDTPVDIIMKPKRSDIAIINEVEKVRTKNNVNWMDILRLAFKHAPKDARKLMGKVNEHDHKISELLKELSNNG